ncbi:flagellar basal body protein [Acidovorax lacteus]|uniref:Flagellar basal body rod protein n=1 Tax=Acidovorax lacteus TaxID=1924988 RepID=A0ABP8LD58_9BURK
MGNLITAASSGLQAAQLRLDSAAHNVANVNTGNFRRQEVVQTEAPGGAGVQASLRKADTPGVALEQEAVDQMAATYAFKANLQTLRTQDRMMGALLDVKA